MFAAIVLCRINFDKCPVQRMLLYILPSTTVALWLCINFFFTASHGQVKVVNVTDH